MTAAEELLEEQEVEFIYCACGCQKTAAKYDDRGRERKYIFTHYKNWARLCPICHTIHDRKTKHN